MQDSIKREYKCRIFQVGSNSYELCHIVLFSFIIIKIRFLKKKILMHAWKFKSEDKF